MEDLNQLGDDTVLRCSGCCLSVLSSLGTETDCATCDDVCDSAYSECLSFHDPSTPYAAGECRLKEGIECFLDNECVSGVCNKNSRASPMGVCGAPIPKVCMTERGFNAAVGIPVSHQDGLVGIQDAYTIRTSFYMYEFDGEWMPIVKMLNPYEDLGNSEQNESLDYGIYTYSSSSNCGSVKVSLWDQTQDDDFLESSSQCLCDPDANECSNEPVEVIISRDGNGHVTLYVNDEQVIDGDEHFYDDSIKQMFRIPSNNKLWFFIENAHGEYTCEHAAGHLRYLEIYKGAYKPEQLGDYCKSQVGTCAVGQTDCNGQCTQLGKLF